MARILYLVPRYSDPPGSGEMVRFYQIRRALQTLGHEVILHVGEQHVNGPAPHGAGPRRLRPVRLMEPHIWDVVSRLLVEQVPDAVIATHAEYSDVTLLARRLRVPVVLGVENYEASLGMMQARKRSPLRQASVILAERFYFPRADRIWTICQEDKRAYERTYRLRAVSVVPHVYALPPPLGAAPPEPLEILLVGTYWWRPNAAAARFLLEDVMPILRRSLGSHLKLTLVGPHVPAWMQQHHGHDVEITGRVPDLTPYYQRATMVVAPVQARGGVKTKVLEAMAFGRPVVLTPASAQGIEAVSGEEMLVAPYTGEDFAAAIVHLAQQPKLRRHMGQAARSLIERRYSPAGLQEVLRGELDGILAPRAVGGWS